MQPKELNRNITACFSLALVDIGLEVLALHLVFYDDIMIMGTYENLLNIYISVVLIVYSCYLWLLTHHLLLTILGIYWHFCHDSSFYLSIHCDLFNGNYILTITFL